MLLIGLKFGSRTRSDKEIFKKYICHLAPLSCHGVKGRRTLMLVYES